MTFDRHLVLDQLGGWRGMVDASLPTIAFIVANGIGGLTVGIWAAVVAAVLVFLLRLVRRESIQQAISGLFAVGVAVFIAARSGEARDFFVLGIMRNAGDRRGPARLDPGPLAAGRRGRRVPGAQPPRRDVGAPAARRCAAGPRRSRRRDRRPRRPPSRARTRTPAPELHWRDDRRMLRAYGWLTVLWGGVFLLRAAVQWVLYLQRLGRAARDVVPGARPAAHRRRAGDHPLGGLPAAPPPRTERGRAGPRAPRGLAARARRGPPASSCRRGRASAGAAPRPRRG